MYVEISGPASGTENMARDLALLESVRRGDASSAMRLYTWLPWAVSLGKNQPDAHIDHHAAKREGFDVVRRPTGGRAVLHANELTYCIVTHRTATPSAQLFYAHVHQQLRSALAHVVGESLTFEQVPPDLRRHYASAGSLGAACFSVSAKSEIMWNGRKVVGSAQYVDDEVIIQHGSILCDVGHERLADVLVLENVHREDVRREILQGAATLTDVAGRPIAPEDIIDSIITHFTS